IARLQRSLGTTTVYVTHDQTEAMTLGDRVAVLRRGELPQGASPRGLYDQPVNPFVARFSRPPPMNFVPREGSGATRPLPPVDEHLRRAIGDRDLVIVGIRPDAFAESDTGGQREVRFDADVDVTEWMGEVLYVYVPFQTHEAVKDQLDELDRELDGEGMRTQMVIALDALSSVREGDVAELSFDRSSLYIFDPSSGENLTRDPARADELEEQAREQRRRAMERARQRAEREEQAAAG